MVSYAGVDAPPTHGSIQELHEGTGAAQLEVVGFIMHLMGRVVTYQKQ